VKFTKILMTGSILLVPALAMGIAQQAPANPVASAEQQQLQPAPALAAEPQGDVVGVIAEVREDSFSVRRDSDQSLAWFTITPELKGSYSGELVTGNHVRVAWMPGDSPDRMIASTISAEGDAKAELDVDLKSDSATATVDTDAAVGATDTAIAQADTDASLSEDSDSYENDSDELPSTASSLPQIATVGLLALLGAAVIAFARRF
jgi:hypothetical protein